MDVVEVKNLTKKFEDVTAVNSITFDCHEKEFLCFLGRPGAGKTTLLRTIAGLEKVDEGEVYIHGDLVNEIIPSKRDIAMVFQNLALYTGWKVYDNIASPLKARKVPKNEINKRVKDVAKLLKIEHLLDRTPVTASGGEKQRIAIARALIRRPRVFLMDEPLSNLDALLRLEMRVELKRMAKELDQTIIYATPDQLEAMSMADRIGMMHKGVMHQLADPDTMYDHPATKTVAGFIGSPAMNFVEGSIEEKGEKKLFNCGSFQIDVSKFQGIIEKESKSPETTLGIRPEDISVSHDKTSPYSLESLVLLVEELGSETILHLRTSGVPINAIAPPDFQTKYGSKIWINMNMDRVHLIDTKAEKVIV
ncbi:MAG: ABC transporter ATP-binding protein [Candidatus Bathyarchaeota archaeon]|nr:ABC transporter ATP-binding protein [Candidatus Bathyarchaeota archaeon]